MKVYRIGVSPLLPYLDYRHGQHLPSTLKLILLLLSGLFLLACNNADKSAAQDYVVRLSNVLDRPAMPQSSPHSAYPRPRDLAVVEPENTLSVREFLSFRQCELHAAVAEKNSLLGKFAESSQALFMDLTILALGPACVSQLHQDGQKLLADKLQSMLKQKQLHLTSSLWKAILGGPENAGFWSINPQPPDYPLRVHQDPRAAIDLLVRFVERVKRRDYVLTKEEETQIENSLARLNYGDGGTLAGHIDHLQNQLTIANTLVKDRLESPLCLARSPTPSARNLQNIVQKFFIPKVQKQAVHLNQRFQQLMPAYQALEAALQRAEPSRYKVWREARDQRLAEGLAATKTHVLLLQQLYIQCGLQPGARVTD